MLPFGDRKKFDEYMGTLRPGKEWEKRLAPGWGDATTVSVYGI